MSQPDVLIVGAGPVGLALAAECHRQGLSLRIVDKAPSHSSYSKALVLWSATIEHLAALGVAPSFIQHSVPARRVIFRDAHHVIAEIPVNQGIESVYPQPLIIPQCDTEALLIGHLRTCGIEVEREVECLSLEQDDHGVTCQLRHADGRTESVHSPWLAGCDGARSAVRHQLPVEFIGVTERMGFILADARATEGLPADGILVLSGPTGTVAVFPVKDGIWRFFSVRKDLEDLSTPTIGEFQLRLDGNGLSGVRLSDPQWLSYFAVNERVVSHNRVGRVFLLGDAAHIHSPAGGQGMNTGIQDAFNLAWKLRLLSSGQGDTEAIAGSYFAERHAVAEAVVKKTSLALHFGLASNPISRALKKVVIPFVAQIEAARERIAGELSELHISYADSPLIGRDSTHLASLSDLRPGTRARDALVSLPGSSEPISLWREFLAPGFTLVLFSGPAPGEVELRQISDSAAGILRLTNAVRPLIVWQGDHAPGLGETPCYLDPSSSAHRRYGLDQSGWYLIRPDQFVAARGTLSEIDLLRIYLLRIV